jgi:hypothetical protein
MAWQVARRSALALIVLAAFIAVCTLIGTALPDAVARVFAIFAAVSLFGAVILLVGWIFEDKRPTGPPRAPGRRLQAVTRDDAAPDRSDAAPPDTSSVRRAA